MKQKVQLIVSDSSLIKLLKSLLERDNCLNKKLKIIRQDGAYMIPTNLTSEDAISEYRKIAEFEVSFYDDEGDELTFDKKLENLILKYDPNVDLDQIRKCIPKRWQIYKPMVLFQLNSFEMPFFQDQFLEKIDQDKFWREVCHELFNGLTHIAINKPIIEQDNEKRIPYNLAPIYGDFGPKITEPKLNSPTQQDFDQEFWCQVLQNNVLQTWAPKYTMFSRGNIVEKQRVLTFANVENNVVIDLYSGIGYFTLHYLVKKPKHVLCWELNPWSNEGLIRSLQAKRISYKLVLADQILDEFDPRVQVYIFQESNENCIKRLKEIGLKLPISHINLGLLPTSSLIWPKMVEICKYRSLPITMLHIHENVHIDKLDHIMQEIKLELDKNTSKQIDIVKLNKIKTYAPDIWHVVCDFNLKE